MDFNPMTERGIPLEKQLRNWSELNAQSVTQRESPPDSIESRRPAPPAQITASGAGRQ
ncbi:MAG TPA: hypothetical protein VIM99_10320 [Blastocatellia bacterium]